MDGFYRGVETSLLALTLVLGLAVAAMPGTATGPEIATTLPMISVSAGEAVD